MVPTAHHNWLHCIVLTGVSRTLKMRNLRVPPVASKPIAGPSLTRLHCVRNDPSLTQWNVILWTSYLINIQRAHYHPINHLFSNTEAAQDIYDTLLKQIKKLKKYACTNADKIGAEKCPSC